MYGPVIFSVLTSGTFSQGQNFIGFEKFLVNVGDSFSLSDGIFKAQRNGIYEFSASLYHSTPNYDAIAVVKNGSQVVSFGEWQGNDTPGAFDDGTLSFSWIMELQKDDKIQLQVERGTFNCEFSSPDCIFNGKLLKNM